MRKSWCWHNLLPVITARVILLILGLYQDGDEEIRQRGIGSYSRRHLPEGLDGIKEIYCLAGYGPIHVYYSMRRRLLTGAAAPPYHPTLLLRLHISVFTWVWRVFLFGNTSLPHSMCILSWNSIKSKCGRWVAKVCWVAKIQFSLNIRLMDLPVNLTQSSTQLWKLGGMGGRVSQNATGGRPLHWVLYFMRVMGTMWLFVLEGVGGEGGGLVWLTPDSYLEHFLISLHPAIIVPPLPPPPPPLQRVIPMQKSWGWWYMGSSVLVLVWGNQRSKLK